MLSAAGATNEARRARRARRGDGARAARAARAVAPWAIVGFLVAFLVVLAAWPETNSLAVIGPHPDGGGRYFGVTNMVETLLLAPALVAAAELGVLPVALLTLVLVGWSRAGADGGAVVVFAAAFAVLWLRLRASVALDAAADRRRRRVAVVVGRPRSSGSTCSPAATTT